MHYWSLTRLADELRDRRVSSVEVTKYLLDRIARLEPALHSYVTVLAEQALAAARRADGEIAAGRYRGPLHGVPIAIKDIFFTADAPTTAGSACLGDRTPRWDATIVRRLAAAGAILLGKQAMTEGALSEHRPDRPPPVNPWNSDYWPGFSSSGSGVGTAAGLCFAAIGTDTGGSIRMPASACGLTGMKPSWGRVSRHGLFPLCESRDHIGPMARNPADAAALLAAIAGPDDDDQTSLAAPAEDYLSEIDQGIAGARIGIDRAALVDGVDAAVAAALADAVAVFEASGAHIREVTLPSPAAYLRIYFAASACEIALAHGAYFADHAAEYGPVLRRSIEAAAGVRGTDVAAVELARLNYCGALARLLHDVDFVLTPVFAVETKTVREIAALTDPATFIATYGRFTIPFNASGNPALVLTCGMTRGGMPIAMQLVGRHLGESALFRAGHAFQRATDWHMRHPPFLD